MLAEQIKECLACETAFKQSDAILKGVSIAFSEQYCSKECETSFEQYLAEQVHEATERGIASNEPIKLNEAEVRKLVNNFHLKLTKDK